eukprot:13418142-Alexandrium_andersonii.AAC.1
MSASLVGSEMCIRDSGIRALTPEKAGFAFGSVVSASNTAEAAARELSGACLLYTSDAADDM